MAGTDAQPLLPQPKEGDPEDVTWALSTAEALWRRGEHGDAITWVRRAAEAASEAEDDLRMLELAKAATELAALAEAFAEPPAPMAEVAQDEEPAAWPEEDEVAPAPSGRISTESIEIDLENAVVESAPARRVASAPPKPPPRPVSKAPGRSEVVPTPNPHPSPLRALAIKMPTADELVPPPPPPLPRGDDGDESMPHVPTVPPPAPDFAPTPMGLRAAPSVRPGSGDRTATVPFGFAALSSHARTVPEPASPDVTTPTPGLGEALLAEPAPPRRTSAFPAAKPAHRSVTPPMGSAPPKPLESLRPPAITTDEGVQRHVSDAPPRAATAPVVIPKAPRPALQSLPTRDVVLDPSRFEVLADVPEDALESLVSASDTIALLPEEQQSAPPMIVVLAGELEVRAPGYTTRLDVVGVGQVRLLAPLSPAAGSLHVVAGAKGARYLAVPNRAVEALRQAAPWAMQELEPASDDVHVVAGALSGKLGARLDGGILDAVLARAKTMRLGPNVPVLKQGEVVRALIIVGAGELSLRLGNDPEAMEIATLDPGEVLFPTELLARGPSPSTVRAGPRGALVVVATRSATEEMLVTVPPLLELLGEG